MTQGKWWSWYAYEDDDAHVIHVKDATIKLGCYSNDFVIDTLPWGGIATVCLGGTTDDVPRSTGSVTCSDKSARFVCVWGVGWGGEEGAAWIWGARWGRGDGAVFCRFSWFLVVFGAFLLSGAWLDLGALAPDDWALLVFADAPVYCHKNQSSMG